MTTEKTLILSTLKVEQKINRLAHQIYENHYKDKELIIVGITGGGYMLAERIANILRNISPLKVQLHKMTINKENPLENSVDFDMDKKELKNKVVILVDDVLNSGKTMMYSTKYLLQADLKQLRTVVLVDRNHRRFPVASDYTGLSLATTLQDHIEVDWKKGKDAVYLI